MIDSKQRVVFLPGHLCTARLWAPQMAALSHEAQCSFHPLVGSDSVAGLAKHVLDHAPEKFSLAGLSMGGYVAFEMMRQAPHRVERLALLDTNAKADRPELLERRQADMQLASDHGMTALTQQLYSRWMHPDHAANLELCNTLDLMATEVGVANQKTQQRAILHRPDSRRTLQGIACPTLVLCGRQDQVTPVADHEEIHALVRHSTLRVIEHCGHLSTIERPAEVSHALLEWLTWY
jgi:pimeloyl-ACP methyl ester carboxylesterase